MLPWWFCFIFSISAAGRWTRPPRRPVQAPPSILPAIPQVIPAHYQKKVIPAAGAGHSTAAGTLWEALAARELTKHTVSSFSYSNSPPCRTNHSRTLVSHLPSSKHRYCTPEHLVLSSLPLSDSRHPSPKHRSMSFLVVGSEFRLLPES
jgi:hypothetical protein